MDYVNLKLKSGEDLIGIRTYETDEFIIVKNPIEITVHPKHGYFAKSWMMLSDENEMKLIRNDLYWCTVPSEKAIRHYDEFIAEIANLAKNEDDSSEWDTVDEMNNDIEEMFQSMLESKSSIKH